MSNSMDTYNCDIVIAQNSGTSVLGFCAILGGSFADYEPLPIKLGVAQNRFAIA